MRKRIAVLTLILMISVLLLTAGAAAGAPDSTSGSTAAVQTGTVGSPVKAAQPTDVPEEETSAEETSAEEETAAEEAPKTSGGETILQWETYSAQLLHYKVNKFEHSDAALYLYMRIINNTDRTMTLKLDNVTVDGVSIIGAGIFGTKPGTDTGEESQEYCLLLPDPDHSEEGSQAIINASEVKAAMILKDSESQEELYRQDVTIHLEQLDSERNVYEQTSAKETAPAADPVEVTVSPTSASTQEKPNYRLLTPYSTGEDVKKLQERLIELGYLDDMADGSLGPNTVAAVKSFNEANGLTGGENADAATQELLFSDRAAAYTEPLIPLQVGSQFEVEASDDNSFFFRVQMANTSKTMTVRGYELEIYITDVWNQRLSDDNEFQTITQKLSPGETGMSSSVYLGNYDKAATVWVGISKVAFTDGEIRDNDNLEFYPCELPSHTTK